MMTLDSTKRPLSAVEARYLKRQFNILQRRRNSIWRRLSSGIVIICGPLAGLNVLAARDLDPKLIVGMWLILGLGIGAWVFLKEWKRLSKLRTRYDEALAQGTAHEFQIVSSRMADFEEIEDEGACFAFELASGGVVFITGQEFYSSSKFPNDDFSIVEFRDAEGKMIDYQIEKRGTKLSPIQRISAREKEGLAMPEHLTVVPGTLESALASLKVV